MDQSACLQRDRIFQYVQGAVDEQEMQEIASHVEGCLQCQAVAEQLDSADDDLIESLRRPAPESPYIKEPECRRALDRLTGLRNKFPWLFQPGGVEHSSDGEWDLPQVLGEYLVLERIGGHLGAVYKAFHLELERLVALKMLPRDLLADDAAAERFKQEIRAVGRLDHPNIVRAQDARQVGGRRFLIMEYVDGSDLAELVRARGPLGIADACELVRQAAVGLQCVYQHGLVHRDIKPANLMLSRDGQVKVLDLGLARFRLQQPPGGEMTGPGLAVGTADYMAPEQVGDSHNVDIRADVYSLGCTLYKLVAGRAPFESLDCESTLDKLNAHLKRPAPPIKPLRSEVPDGLAALLDRMLAKNPAERFQTPDQVAAALAPLADGCNLQALVAAPTAEPPRKEVPDTPPARSTRWFWELLALAAAVLLLAFGGKMLAERFGPFFSGGASETVASSNPLPNDGQPEETSEATAHESVGQSSPPEPDAAPPRPKAPSPAGDETPGQSASASSTTELPKPNGAIPPDRPLAFDVRAELDHPDGVYHGPPSGPDGKGELIRVTITSEQSGYLYLLNRQADGTLVCLFPNLYQPDNKIAPDRPVTVPNPEGDFELRASPPYGAEVLVALVTLKPLLPAKFGVASLTDQQFTVVDRQAVEQLREQIKKNPRLQALGGGGEAEVQLTTQPDDQEEPQSPERASPPPDQPQESTSPRPDMFPEALRPGDHNGWTTSPASPRWWPAEGDATGWPRQTAAKAHVDCSNSAMRQYQFLLSRSARN